MYNSSNKVKVDVVYDTDIGKDIPIYKIPEKNAFFFTSKLAIDADGSPRAYNPQDTGLDTRANASQWLVKDDNGNLCVQKNDDASPGSYVSATTLNDENRSSCDYRKYVNSEEIPYIALPPALNNWDVKVGDFGVAINLNNMKMAYVIYADIGPNNKIGEGSIALANALDINSSPRIGGTGQNANVFYIVFPNSGQGSNKLRTLEEINLNGQKLFEAWGGMNQVNKVLQ